MSLADYVKENGYRESLYSLIRDGNTEDAMTLAQCIFSCLSFTSEKDETEFENMVVDTIKDLDQTIDDLVGKEN